MTNPIELGDITIYQIFEQQRPLFPVFDFFPTLSRELFETHRSWLEPDFIDPLTNQVILRVQSYLIKTKRQIILVDGCVGNHKNLSQRPVWHQMDSDQFKKNFDATGIQFEDVDVVVCTHLHIDHVGWNTVLKDGRWVPAFPNAEYQFSGKELEFWMEKYQSSPDDFTWIAESILPVIEAGKVKTVDSNHLLDDGVQFLSTPGHSIDHFSILVGEPGEDALITGDLVISPIQARIPELGMFSDFDATMANNSRRYILERFCDTSTLICTTHYPTSSAGRVTRWRDGFWIS